MPEPYDPLNYDNLARNVVSALLEIEPAVLPPSDPFQGTGVYAMYYMGDLKYYRAIASPKCDIPIYVGKAIPKGGRKGTSEAGAKGYELFARLQQHANSVKQAENLRLEHFKCRYLVVVPVWITLAERFLIDHFRPLWNTVVDGFGNHPPGAGRASMRRPRWDILHPGRAWAGRLQATETQEDVIALLERNR